MLERAVIIARHFGMGTTEIRAIEQLYLWGPMTSGELGRSLALTSGSVTALVRRLLANDIVERRVDAQDRRKVWISINPNKVDWIIQPYYSAIAQGQAALEKYTADELALIVRFLDDYRQASTNATTLLIKELKKERARPHH